MWVRLLAPLALVALAAGTAGAKPPWFPPARVRLGGAELAQELATAIRARDARTIAKRFDAAVATRGIAFLDPACARRFARPQTVRAPHLDMLARCFAQLRLQTTTRRSALADAGVLTYEPGIELELAFRDGRVRWIGHPQQTASDPVLPTLTAQLFESLRRAGSTDVDDLVRPQLEKLVKAAATTSVWLRVCLGASGSVTSTEASPNDAIGAAFREAIAGWQFRPFELRGKQAPACSLTLLTYPAARAPVVEVLPAPLAPEVPDGRVTIEDDFEITLKPYPGATPPPPPVPPQTAAMSILELGRRTGTRTIAPDPATQAEMARRGLSRVHGIFRMCLDLAGDVASVSPLRSTGFPAYDGKILRDMQMWSFRPYLATGAPTTVCTVVTIVHAATP